jgi:hypothetical protein
MQEISRFRMRKMKKKMRGNVGEHRVTVIEIRFTAMRVRLRMRLTLRYEQLQAEEEIWLSRQLARICRPAWK